MDLKKPNVLSFGIDVDQFIGIVNGVAKLCSCFGMQFGNFLENEAHLLHNPAHMPRYLYERSENQFL